MPYDQNNQWYPAPITLTGAQVAHRYTAATETLDVFSLRNAKDLDCTLNIHEHYVTAMTGANNDVVFIAKSVTPGDTVTVALVDPSANNAALSIPAIVGTDIIINLATGAAGAITTTAAQLKAAIEANAGANALIACVFAGSDTGAGIVTALAAVTLAGGAGTTPTLDVILQTSSNAGLSYRTGGSFTQNDGTDAGSESKVFTNLGLTARWKATIGGTASPAFAYSISAIHRP